MGSLRVVLTNSSLCIFFAEPPGPPSTAIGLEAYNAGLFNTNVFV